MSGNSAQTAITPIMGRPTIFTEELADRILDRHAAGEGLKAICQDSDMPDRRTVQRWVEDGRGTFATDLTHARKAYAEALMFDARTELDITDAELVELKSAASPAVNIRQSRSRWAEKMAAAMDRETYGEKVSVDVKGEVAIVAFADMAVRGAGAFIEAREAAAQLPHVAVPDGAEGDS